MHSHTRTSSEASLPEPPPLLSVLKALPADCVRNNLISAFGRLSDIERDRTRPPIADHQWLPGQWTPLLFGLSRDWRTYARCVLTHTLTVDLAIAVSLQRPYPGAPVTGSDTLETFLTSFPSLQHLTLLAGNGGAPVDDSCRIPRSSGPGTGGSSTLLAMAEAVHVALAAHQILHLDSSSQANTAASGPRLASLELRMHPAVWRALSGNDPDGFLRRLAATHSSLEALALHVAPPPPPVVTPLPPDDDDDSSLPTASSRCREDPVAVVGLAVLASLPGLSRLRVTGPIMVEGLAELTGLKALTLEGAYPASESDCALQTLTALTTLRLADGHIAPTPTTIPSSVIRGGPPDMVLLSRARNPRIGFGTLHALHMPDVTIGPKEWLVLMRLSPNLKDLEIATATPYLSPPSSSSSVDATGKPSSTAAALAAAAAANGGAVPDWFLRATVGDEVVYGTGCAGAGHGHGGFPGKSGGSGSGGLAMMASKLNGLLPSGISSRLSSGSARSFKGLNVGGASGCPFAAAVSGARPAATASGAPPAALASVPSQTAAGPLPGVQRLVLWKYGIPQQLADLIQLLPDLQDLRAPLLFDDPPDVPAAALRPAAVAALRPLVEALRPLRDIRLTVSCDPAAVTGQLACIFLMESGLAAVAGIQGLSLSVWVAAEAQLGSLAALAQLRSLELTLGKQEQESELSVLTRLGRLSYLSLRITPGIWNEIQGRIGRVSAGAALRLAMSFAAGQVLLLVADVHREICEDEAISLVKSVEMTTGQPGAAWAVSAWVEETAECIMGFGPSAGGSGTMGEGGGAGAAGAGDGGVLRVVWTPELVRRLLGVVPGAEAPSARGTSVSFMGAEEERLGRVLGS